MYLGAVIRHYNKSGFAVKHVEHDGDFRSSRYEVCNDMGI